MKMDAYFAHIVLCWTLLIGSAVERVLLAVSDPRLTLRFPAEGEGAAGIAFPILREEISTHYMIVWTWDADSGPFGEGQVTGARIKERVAWGEGIRDRSRKCRLASFSGGTSKVVRRDEGEGVGRISKSIRSGLHEVGGGRVVSGREREKGSTPCKAGDSQRGNEEGQTSLFDLKRGVLAP